MVLRSLAMLAAFVVLLAQAPGLAADTDTDWQAGHDAFAAGDFASALAFFRNARDRGLGGPAVLYNIGVCEYELGDYAAARETFGLIAAQFPKMRGLAEYNVGLAERRLGNAAAAQRRFISAWHASDDPKVRALAASQLTELDRERPTDRYATISITAGHDDNIALRDRLGLPAGASDESPLAELFATLDVPFLRAPSLAFEGGLYVVAYPDADDFDQAELRAGIRHTGDVGDWQLQTGLYAVTGTLGGSGFNEELNADVRATRYLSDAASIEVRFRYDEIRGTEAMFDGIDGNRGRVDVRYRWQQLPHYLVLRGGVEQNDRRDEGVSPDRQRLQATYFRRLGDRWEIELGASIRSSDYSVVSVSRDEDLATAALGASYGFGDGNAVTIRYQYSENSSSDPLFSYRRNLFTVGIRYLFQP